MVQNLGHTVGTHHHAWHCCCYSEWDCHWQGSSWGTQNFFSHPLSLLILISILVAQILCGCWGFSCVNASRNCATNYDICKMTTKVEIGNDHFLGSYVCPIAQALWAHLNKNGDYLILMRVVIILMHNFTASTTPTNNQLIDVVTMCVGVCAKFRFYNSIANFCLGSYCCCGGSLHSLQSYFDQIRSDLLRWLQSLVSIIS